MSPHSEEIRSALAFVPAHDRQTWLKIGMAVKSELGEEGFDLWSEWSQADESYNERDARAVWRSISPAGGISIKTLYGEAVSRGWKPANANGHAGGGSNVVRTNGSREQARQELETQQAQRRHEAQQRAVAIWKAADAVTDEHPYLRRKGVKAHGLRLYRGDLVIRDLHCDGALIVPLRGCGRPDSDAGVHQR